MKLLKFIILVIILYIHDGYTKEKKIIRYASLTNNSLEKKVCGKSFGNDNLVWYERSSECHKKIIKYIWNDRSNEIMSKIDQLSKLIEKAIISKKEEDYKKLELYFEYPFKFDVQYEKRTSEDDYTLIANNIHEFTAYFNHMNNFSEGMIKFIKKYGLEQSYSTTFTMTIEGHDYYIYISYICDGRSHKSNESHNYVPEELHDCKNIDFKIDKVKALLMP